eukprot:77274-Chlamydomonas_euryale.AAC.7
MWGCACHPCQVGHNVHHCCTPAGICHQPPPAALSAVAIKACAQVSNAEGHRLKSENGCIHAPHHLPCKPANHAQLIPPWRLMPWPPQRGQHGQRSRRRGPAVDAAATADAPPLLCVPGARIDDHLAVRYIHPNPEPDSLSSLHPMHSKLLARPPSISLPFLVELSCMRQCPRKIPLSQLTAAIHTWHGHTMLSLTTACCASQGFSDECCFRCLSVADIDFVVTFGMAVSANSTFSYSNVLAMWRPVRL